MFVMPKQPTERPASLPGAPGQHDSQKPLHHPATTAQGQQPQGGMQSMVAALARVSVNYSQGAAKTGQAFERFMQENRRYNQAQEAQIQLLTKRVSGLESHIKTLENLRETESKSNRGLIESLRDLFTSKIEAQPKATTISLGNGYSLADHKAVSPERLCMMYTNRMVKTTEHFLGLLVNAINSHARSIDSLGERLALVERSIEQLINQGNQGL